MPDLSAVAVVIPAGPGDRAWEGLLPLLSGFGEVVLSGVAGDDLPPKSGTITVTGPAGRARQLNVGAAASALPWLLFLHADSRPDSSLAAGLRRAPDGDYLGYCTIRYYDGPPWMRLTEAGVWLRSRVFGLPFGDQGMLMSRAVFERLGGFDERIACGEDHALVWAARHAGLPLQPLAATLPTSARRYVEAGWWTVTRSHLAKTWAQARSWRRAGLKAQASE
ncbi:MAG: glycosyl transferase family 2 [Xanthomonadales bacterium]|nr:glycosyl transferase family 2 [Xanthomonadales bacterium]